LEEQQKDWDADSEDFGKCETCYDQIAYQTRILNGLTELTGARKIFTQITFFGKFYFWTKKLFLTNQVTFDKKLTFGKKKLFLTKGFETSVFDKIF